MDITERMKSFYERWNMTMDTKADAKAFQKRALYSLEINMSPGINDNRARDIYYQYFRIIGQRVAPKGNSHVPMYQASIINYIEDIARHSNKDSDFFNFLKCIQVLFWVEEFPEGNKDELARLLNIDLKNSFFNISIKKIGESYEFLPEGVALLDKKLVDDILSWLTQFPEAEKSYHVALTNYMQAEIDPSDLSLVRSVMDNLRHALELFFKQFFEKDIGWDKLKQEIGAYLKEKEVSKYISNMYINLLNCYEHYQNSSVKHDMKAKAEEMEYMIYLTGTFIRFLIQTKETA